MSILGKLLIVFNLLAAGAFAYFTLENWKVRQELTWSAVDREVKLTGLPLTNEAPKDDVGADRVPFLITVKNTRYTSIPKARFDKLIPNGGDQFGGPSVGSQTDEIKRVQQKVMSAIPGPDQMQPRFSQLYIYQMNLARTGAERDGVNALYEYRDPARQTNAKRDLAFLAKTNSQTNALQAMADIESLKDPQAIVPEEARVSRIRDVRVAVKRFLSGEAPHGLPAGTAESDEAYKKLVNAVEAAFKERPGDAEKRALIDAATGDTAGWTELANAAVEPLSDKPSCDRAIEALGKFAAGKATTPTETAAINGIKTLINPPALNFVADSVINDVATNALNSKFDEAALPVGAHKGQSAGEKGRKIAHILYHLDANRHAEKANTQVVADRKAWHERVANVIGMPEYIRAAEAQANEYAEAGQRLISVITEEQSAFEAEYQGLQQKVLALYSQWLTLDAQLKAQEVITNENDRLRKERLTERDTLLADLAKATEEAKASLAKLQDTQKKLYAIQKDLRDAQAAILTLEKELRFLELGPDAKN